MSASLKSIVSVPVDTYQAAREVYNLAHVYLVIGDRLNTFLKEDFSPLDPSSNLDSATALMLALVTAFQYAESLPDGQAEAATRKRMDWKYALHLALKHPGFSAVSLCEFRRNLLTSSEGQAVFHRLLCFLGEIGLYSKADLRAIDPGPVLAHVCKISQIERLSQAVKSEMSRLVAQNPDWLRTHAPPQWFARYANGLADQYVILEPDELVATAERFGADIERLLLLYQQNDFPGAGSKAASAFLKQLLEEQFIRYEDGLHWRDPGCHNCAFRVEHNR